MPPALPGFSLLKTGSYYIALPGLAPATQSSLAKNSEVCLSLRVLSRVLAEAGPLCSGLGTMHISGPDTDSLPAKESSASQGTQQGS